MTFKFFCQSLIALTFLISATAQAVPIRWEVHGQFFPDANYLSGGFTFDPASNAFSNITLSIFRVESFPDFPYQVYDNAIVHFADGSTDTFTFNEFTSYDNGATEEYWLTFSGLEPSRPGSFTFDFYELYETRIGPFGHISYHEAFNYGTAIGVPVPEPETYAMMLAGLGLLGFTAKRRTFRKKVEALTA